MPNNANGELQQLVTKWRGWLARLDKQVLRLYSDRAVSRRVAEVANASPKLRQGNRLLAWIFRNHYKMVAVDIRRLLDNGRDAVSLARLAKDIVAHAEKVTREWYLAEVARYGCPTATAHAQSASSPELSEDPTLGEFLRTLDEKQIHSGFDQLVPTSIS